MSRIETDELKELFAEWGLWSLVDDISPDGDGHGDNLQLTKEGLEAERMINLLLSDQSQNQQEKQEEWYCECGERVENGEHICDDKYKKKVKLGKQDEWKERLAKYLKGTEYALWYGNEWDLSDEVEEFISQLLSEKTFNKEELKYLKACTGIVYDEWKIDGKKIDTTMVERLRLKISKLLKE